jgi:eukaryotic-like serine/threonine-protein kinase
MPENDSEIQAEVIPPRPPPVDRPVKPPVVVGTGTLALSAKPPCKIFIDGRDTGKVTPERALELPAGSHRVTLMNNEFGIKESFSVKIKAGESTRSIKDFTDQIQ